MTVNINICLLLFIVQKIYTITANNRARSPIPPLDLPLDDIPMFLTITFNDVLDGESYKQTEKISNHTNRNNEQIPLVYYVSNEYSDYSKIQQRYLQGSEIATHTVTHTTNVDTNIAKWYHEIQQSKELISTHADIPMNNIIGFRAPYLQKSHAMFQVLNGINDKYMYDSSIINALNDDNLFDWPYTLDNYNGLWEIPMYYLYSDLLTKQHFDILDYTANYSVLFNSFKNNFVHRLNTNKSPMGLYFHSDWLNIQSNVDALNDFIEWVLHMNNTWIVTNKQVIEWINKPIINSEYYITNNNKLINDRTNFTLCPYSQGSENIFCTVQKECPVIMPHMLTWNQSQLIHSEIMITSNNNNIITTQHNMCGSAYTIYKYEMIYCSTATVKEIVRYNNSLYQCQFWTQREIPNVNNAWLLIKDCMIYTDSFVQGSVVPYGIKDVFIDNVLNIYIQPYHGYEIDSISVIVNNYYYHLNYIFDDYELSMNTTTRQIILMIKFIAIKFAKYEIKISFKNVPTITSTQLHSISPSTLPSVKPIINVNEENVNVVNMSLPQDSQPFGQLSLKMSYATLVCVLLGMLFITVLSVIFFLCLCQVIKKQKLKMIRQIQREFGATYINANSEFTF